MFNWLVIKEADPLPVRIKKYNRFAVAMVCFVCVVSFVQIAVGVLNLVAAYDRAALHESDLRMVENQQQIRAIQEEQARAALANRQMLNARARVQIINIIAGHRRNAFLPGEEKEISDLWQPTEYSFVQPNPFLESGK